MNAIVIPTTCNFALIYNMKIKLKLKKRLIIYQLLIMNTLELVMKSQKNIDLFSKNLSKVWKDEEERKDVIYETAFALKSGVPINTVLNEIKTCETFWDFSNFSKYLLLLKEKDDFLTKPISVEDGVLKCPKCGFSKTFTYSTQNRSGDEATSVYGICRNGKCGHKWRANND